MVHFLVYKIGQMLVLGMPLRTGYKLAEFISDLHYFFSHRDRQAVRDNLHAIFPQKSQAQLHRIEKQVFRNFGKYLVDFLRFSKLDNKGVQGNVEIVNSHYIKEALAKKRGVILLTAHLGNWELGGAIVALGGYRLWAVALPHKHKFVDNFFNRQRESKGVKVIPLAKGATSQCLKVLRNNGLLALVGDRDFTERGVAVDFFRRSTLFPLGPAVFSLKTGAPIIPGFMLRDKDDRFTLRLERPIEIPDTGSSRKDVIDIIRRYKVIFEEYISKYPEQWYMFRRYWIA